MLAEVVVNEGETVEVGALLGSIGRAPERGTGCIEAAAAPTETPQADTASEAEKPQEPTPSPAAPTQMAAPAASSGTSVDTSALSPAARRVVEEHGLDPAQITGTGKDGRLTKEDALKAASGAQAAPASPAPSAAAAPVAAAQQGARRAGENDAAQKNHCRAAERKSEHGGAIDHFQWGRYGRADGCAARI